ncbi:metal ABC transporter substrate-binding protein [Catellatospora sp. KI3]|uniref:metal ABC transporter substrate-binding protein n=1 Tax=Catellatospora sp. KI3 TaxID=3041620 RepID=UPI002482397E|nr:metal ABC transporter substrate-binding protein [Catellatospora sp. KI3]MDI1466388.1 metal ABC transporter substrate-binding protein [Catellatospora sp. KI3]
MLSRSLRRAAVGGAATVLLLALAACSGTSGDDGKVSVVTGFYPLQFVTERIGGDHVKVTNLAQPGAEPHDIELKPSQIGEISDAKLVIRFKGVQPQLDDAVGQNAAGHDLDVSTVTPPATGANHRGATEDAGAPDPHVWLDPTRLAAIAGTVSGRLSQLDPDHAADYADNADALLQELTKLDGEYAAGLKQCQRHEIVTSHAAFGYLADRYGLTQIALSGLTPDTEPTPQQLATVAAEAKRLGATTIFFETLVSPKVAETLAAEVGAKTAVLDPLEGLTEGGTGDYLSVMRTNLEALRAALGCA